MRARRALKQASGGEIGGRTDVSFEQAKRKAMELRSQIVLGGNPAEEKANRKAVITFKELARMHVARAEIRKHRHGVIPGLYRETREVDGFPVQPRWRTGLQPPLR